MNDILGNLYKNDDHNKVVFNKKKLREGVEIIGETVGSTLGAQGQTGLVHTPQGPYVTKDGYYLSTLINLEDKEQMLAVQAIRQASQRLSNVEGDGTTTCTVLAHAIITQSLDINENPTVEFIDGLADAVGDVLKSLEEQSIPMTEDNIKSIALTSVNQDKDLADIITKIFKEVGIDGSVGFRHDPHALKSRADIVHGSTIPLGWSKPEFINLPEHEASAFNNPLILVSNAEIANAKEVVDLLSYAKENNQPLVIIAHAHENFEATLVANKTKHNTPVCLIKPDHTVDTEMLKDIAAVVGAKYFDGSSGDALDTITPDYFGTVDQIFIKERDTKFVVSDKKDVSKRLELVEKKLKEEKGFALDRLNIRRGILKGVVGSVVIGAPTKIEADEIKDRVEDGIKAIASSLRQGFLPGGGIALLKASRSLKAPSGDSDYAKGYKVLTEAVKAPYRRILSNAGLDDSQKLKGNEGIDVLTGKVVDMVSVGIIDPTIVTMQALINAFSPSVKLLRTGPIFSPINTIKDEN